MRILISLLVALLSLASCSTQKNNDHQPTINKDKGKILFVCTNTNEVNGLNNGTFLSEIAVPFILLEEQDFEIDIVSPQGGSIPIYYKFDTTEVIQRALNSEYYHRQIQNSQIPKKVSYNDYSAVVLPGGYGQFWDVHNDKDINELIAMIYENGGLIGALGHGTSSLVNIKLSNGEHLVKGVTLTCFPSWFEKEVMFEADYGKLLPFDMEVELEKKGAKLKRVDKETRSNGQIIDSHNRIITASSATGGEFIAEELIKLLKLK